MKPEFYEFLEIWGREFIKMNPEFLESLETWVREFLKNESGIFQNFGNLGTRIFFKNESRIFGIFGNLGENDSKIIKKKKKTTLYKTIRRWHFKN